RSLEFKHETLHQPNYQPVAVVNYPNDSAFTRVTEFKHLTGQEHPKTSIMYEFPKSEGDAYYPIPRRENADLCRKYQELADQAGVHFVGRLASYKYYNMDQVVAQAITVYAHLTNTNRPDAAAMHHEPTLTTVTFPLVANPRRPASRCRATTGA